MATGDPFEVSKAFNAKQLRTVARLQRSKSDEVARRAFRVGARDGRTREQNRIVRAERSSRDFMESLDRGGVPKAMRRRGYNNATASIAVDRATLANYKKNNPNLFIK